MHSICRGFWFFQGHTWTHAPAQAHTMHTHTHSENALAQFRGEARPVSSPGLTVEGGEWELIEFAQLQPMGLQTILQDSHSPPHTHTWKAASYYTLNLIRAYVYGSEHMWPPLFPRPPPTPASLSFYLSINVSFCLSHGLLLLLSVWLPVCFETFYLFHSSYRSTFKRWQGMWFSESKSKAH